jgi:hypothetical protein
MLLQSTTPEALTEFVEKCAAKLSGNPPIYVPYEQREGATVSGCFTNVRKAVEEEGGTIIYGWMLWELKGALIEAEHHAVWEKPDGTLVDITPKRDGEQSIVFVRDDSAIYTGKFIDMKRFAAFGNSLARTFIKVKGEVDALIKPYRAVGQYTVPPDVMAKAAPKDVRAMKLYRRLREGKRQ